MHVSLKLKIIFSAIIFLFPFLIYLYTLSPDVTFIDSGELATACLVLGTAHPTGYPFFTVLGKIFSFLPVGEYIYRLNLMAAITTSCSLVVFFFLLIYLFEYLYLTSQKDKSKTNISATLIYLSSFTATLTLAFSKTFWSISNSIEVYSLHILLITLIIFTFLRAGLRTDKRKEVFYILFAYLLGLSFTNHMSTLFLSLGLIYFYFAINGFNEVTFKRLLILIIPFLAGLSFYIYLPIRGDNPIINWGNPVTLENFYRHVTGKQFSVWMFSSFEITKKQFNYFISAYPKEFLYFPLILSVLGLFELFSRNKKIAFFTIILFIFNILYAINYDIYDIDTYFLLTYIVNCFWIGFGIIFIFGRLKINSKISYIMLLIPLILLFFNFDKNNERENFYVRDYTNNVFNSARPYSLIISTQWDFFVSASLYYQNIKNVRPDVIVIDKELLRKSWYLKHVEEYYPVIYNRSRNEFETFKTELIKFEKYTDKYTKPVTNSDFVELKKIQEAFKNLLNSFVYKNQDLNIYVTSEIEFPEMQTQVSEKFALDYFRVPEGVLIRLTNIPVFDSLYTPPEYSFQITHATDYHRKFIMEQYYLSYMNRANYLMNYSKLDEAETYINKGLPLISPDSKNDDRKKMADNLLKKLRELRELQRKNQ
ncbi:MAG: DUF2723 domain-containing protein [Ignavibacteria bacterium]|nr:DUF2723 domain-containing protein [Ignavibacteria bacterium]